MVFVFALGSYLLPQILGRPSHWTLSVLITDQAIYQSNIPFAAAMAVFLMLIALALVGLTLMVGRGRRGMIGRLWMAAVAVFLALPLVVVAGVSVNEMQSLVFPPEGFSLAWYAQVFLDPAWRAALIHSLVAGGAARRRWRC